jgi:hypothetical protein
MKLTAYLYLVSLRMIWVTPPLPSTFISCRGTTLLLRYQNSISVLHSEGTPFRTYILPVGLCIRYVHAIEKWIEVDVATFGSSIEDKMFALAKNLTRVAQLWTRKSLHFAEERSEYCCVWRSTGLQYGISPREGGQRELTGASVAPYVCRSQRSAIRMQEPA